jgi:putative endonuclease
MARHLETGQRGETLAAEHLTAQGYEIVARNYRAGRGEIDLIVRRGDWLVFVEVKTRTNLAYGYPEAAVSERKAALVVATAEAYVFEVDWKKHIRFDVVAVVFSPAGTQLEHFEDAFY